MDEKEKQKLDNLNKRYKKQNEAIANKYDRISATLPKGTVERIKAHGLTVNGVINDCILKFLDSIENEQNDHTSGESTKSDKSIGEVSNAELLAELQAKIDARKTNHQDEMTIEEREQARKSSIIRADHQY